MKTKIFNILLLSTLVLFVLFGMVSPAHAQGIIVDDSISKGEKIEQNVVLTGDVVRLDGSVIGDVLAIGNRFELNGEVDGNLIILATEANINGTVGRNLFNAAISTTMQPDADIGMDFYILSGDLTTNPGSTIGRDLVAYTLGAQLQGEVGRNTQGFIGLGPLASILWEQIKKIELPQIEFPFHETTPITFAGLNINISPIISSTLSSMGVDTQQSGGIQWDVVGEWFLARLRALAVYLVLGVIFMLLFPRFLEESAEMIWKKPLQSTGMGIVLLVFVLASFILLLGLLIPLMLFFSWITLEGLAVITGFVGYSSLILGMTLFVIYGLYLTKVIAGYLIGKRILNLAAPGAIRYRILSLLLGGILLVLIGAIPFLTIIISAWLSLVGIGAAWYVWRTRRETRHISSEEAQPMDPTRAMEVEDVLEEPLSDDVMVIGEELEVDTSGTEFEDSSGIGEIPEVEQSPDLVIGEESEVVIPEITEDSPEELREENT